MNKLRFLTSIILAVLASCSEKDSSEKAAELGNDFFSVKIDTVQVDAGKENFIYLTSNLGTSSISSDKKTLYNLNPKAPRLEVIDLDALALKEIIKLENEGPTGIGTGSSYMPMMDMSDEGELFWNSWNYMIKLNAARDLISKYWFSADSLKGDPLSDEEMLFPEGFISDDGDYFYSTYGHEDGKYPKKGLAILNLSSKELKKIPLEIFDKIDDLSIVFRQDGNDIAAISEQVFIIPFDKKILISSTAYNEIFILDLTDLSIEKKSFHSQLTNDFNNRKYVKRARSKEELFELRLERMKEVSFYEFLYDDQNEKFWRFSKDLHRMIGEVAGYKTLLTIFDKDLNQLHEQQIAFFPYSGNFSFFKDGSFYSYINLEDELGFVRIKPIYE